MNTLKKKRIEHRVTNSEFPTHSSSRIEFIKRFSDFDWMWNGNLSRINIAKHLMKLSPANAKPINSTPYQASPKARKFKENEIDKKCCRMRLSSWLRLREQNQ